MADEELVRIRATFDNSDLKRGGDESVRTLSQVKGAIAALPGQLRQSTSSFSTMTSSFTTFSKVGQTTGKSLEKVNQETSKAGKLFRELRGPLQNIGLDLVGVTGHAGKFVEKLGLFAVGGGLTLAITAGFALIIEGIRSLGRAAREERERVDGLIKSLEDAAKARAGDVNPYKALQKDAEDLLKRQREIEKELEQVLRPKAVTTNQGGTFILPIDLERAKELRKEITAIGQALAERSIQAQEREQANAEAVKTRLEREKREREQAAREAKRLADQRLREVQSIEDAERELALLRAKATSNAGAEEAAIRDQERVARERAVAGVERLSALERERLAAMLEQVDAAKALLRTLSATEPVVAKIAALQRQGGANLRADAANARRPGDQRVTVPGGIPDPFGPGGALGLVRGAAFKGTLGQIGLGIAGNLGGQLAGALGAKGGVLGGTLGGALSGFLSGGPVGGIIGGVGGLIGGLFGGGSKKKEERNALRGQIDDFIGSISEKGPPLQEALKGLKDRFQELYDQGKKLGLSQAELNKLTREYREAQARLRAEFEAQQARFRDNLEARALEAQGLAEEAAARRAALAAQEEIRAAEAAGYDKVTIARLREVQELEAEAEAKRKAAQAAEELRRIERERTDIVAGLIEREQRLAGDQDGANRTALENAAAAQRRAAQDQLESGLLTEDLYKRIAAVIDGELAQALQKLEDDARAAAEAAEAAAQAQQEAVEKARLELRDTIRIRELRLEGLTAEALRAEAAARAQKELEAAQAAQGTDEDLSRLAAVLDGELRQALEALAQAAIDKAEALRQAEREFTQDVQVELLRATGRGDEADRLELEQRQARRLADAIAKGFGDDTIKLLGELQKAQRDQLLAEQQARLEQTTVGTKAAERERLGTAEVRSITAGQADSMIAYLASITAYTRAMAQAAGVAGGADRALATANSRAAQAAGIRPTL